MKGDRSSKPRGKPGPRPERGGPRKPSGSYGAGEPRRPMPARARPARADVSNPYKPARRPAREFGERGERGERFERGQRGGFGERGGRGFTVTLDPDVARVFRGDASVNRALRLVLQLLQVVQGPPRPAAARPPRGYQGTPEARGFTRRPRFEDEEDAGQPEE
jgi:hypothetical protein